MSVDIHVFPDGRVTARDAARYIGLSYKTLAAQRSNGSGPPFLRVGGAVFYFTRDLDEWISSCRVNSTAEYRAKKVRS